ncbi:hypothetical protein B7463_g4882, partial [Scytalidium lignicola]
MESSGKVSRRQRNARSRPGTKVELQFVNVVPNRQEQKAETQAIIRANAAHFHWRHNRPPRDKCKLKKSRDSVVHDHDEVNSCTSLQLKNTQLGFDVVDPFSSYECDLPRDFVNRCITFNAQVILPALFPGDADNFNIRANLLQLSISNPCMLHMFIIGALINSQGTPGAIPTDRIVHDVFRSRAEIVRRMSTVMGDPVEACKDINIFAITALVKIGQFKKVDVPLKTPNQGPLRSLQFMSSFGLMASDPVHFDGLSRLIELKGGLEKIEMPGLAALISFAGLLIGTRDLTAPRYPVVTLSCPPKEFIFQHQGAGFSIDQDLYIVLSMLNSYTMMIDDFSEGRKDLTATVLIDHRNTTQHALLSLPPMVGSSECYRLAALIYSLLVIFPLPYIASPFQCLVTQLKIALTGWDGSDQMLIWVLTMGGIGAMGLGERGWFVNKFRRAVARMGVRSWNEAREVIKMGLWFEATNDRDGIDFWLESQNV